MCYKYGHYNATFQTRMKIEDLSNELFRWLQTGLRQNFCLLRAKRAKQLDAPWLLNWTNPCQCWPPNKLHPSIPKETFEGSKVKGKTTTDYSMKHVAYVAKTVCQKLSVTLSQTWQLNQSVCTVPIVIWMSASMIDLSTFVRLSSNYVLYQQFFP